MHDSDHSFHIPIVDAQGRRINDNHVSAARVELPPPPKSSAIDLIPFIAHNEIVSQRMGDLIARLVRDSNDPNHPGLVMKAEEHEVGDICMLLDAIDIRPNPADDKAAFVKMFLPAVNKAKELALRELETGEPCLSPEDRAAIVQPEGEVDGNAARRSRRRSRKRRSRRAAAAAGAVGGKSAKKLRMPKSEVARFARRLLDAYGDHARRLVADLQQRMGAEGNRFAVITCERIANEMSRLSRHSGL